MAAFDPGLARRLTIALVVSVTLHAVVLLVVRAKPPAAGQSGAPVLVAWIERAADPAQAEQTPPPEISSPEARSADTVPPQVPAADSVVEPNVLPPSSVRQPPAVAQSRPAETQSGIEIPALRDPTYYPIGALDRLPLLLGSADACYPQGATGEVAFLLLIDDTGTVNEAAVLEVRPEGLFTAAAAESCRALKFTPARKDGRAVRSRVRFVVGPKPTGSALQP